MSWNVCFAGNVIINGLSSSVVIKVPHGKSRGRYACRSVCGIFRNTLVGCYAHITMFALFGTQLDQVVQLHVGCEILVCRISDRARMILSLRYRYEPLIDDVIRLYILFGCESQVNMRKISRNMGKRQERRSIRLYVKCQPDKGG